MKQFMLRQTVAFALFLVVLVTGMSSAYANTLRIGTQNAFTLDPHFLQQDSNVAYNQNIYGALTDMDAHGHLLPDLAVSWTATGTMTWRFILRHGVTFHDGTPFTADDVVFSLARVRNVPNNAAPYTGQLLGVTAVRKIDDETVDIDTDGFSPLLPAQIAKLAIVSKHVAEGKTTQDFNDGKAAIGTGPYRIVEVQGREKIILARFDKYWGTKPDWDQVEFHVLPNDSARSAALLAGDVDLIEFVPLQDTARIAAAPGFVVHSGASSRVMYLGLNLDPKLDISGGRNVLLDPRVRKAISLSINRDGIVRNLLLGYGRVATQIGVPGMLGYLEQVQPDPFAAEAARGLLAEAGFPNGFATSIVCPNGRYVADSQVCQAIGQMLARIGIKATVETIPASMFFTRVRTGANSAPLFLGAWSNVMGDAGYTLNNMFHTIDAGRLMGSTNRSSLSDQVLDHEIDAALTERDPPRRLELLRSAEQRAIESRALLPLFTAPVVLASKASISYDVGDSGSAEMTSAMRAHPR